MTRRTSFVRRGFQVFRAWRRYFAIPVFRRRAANRAERAQTALEELGGAWVKLGQALALRFDILPEDYCLQFFRLLNQMAPFPADEVRRVVESELGRPLEELFREFDPVPLAAASIGQVHRAEMRDGTVVAVKVQRPGVRELVRADLRWMRWIARLIDWLPWSWRPQARRLVDEFARWTAEELDFRTEARHLATLSRNAEGDPLERIPRLYASHSSKRVLTLELLEGTPVVDIIAAKRRNDEAFLRDLASRGHDLRRIASHIAWNALNQIYRQGCFHADPHPANLIVLPGDAIGYVDFGIVGQLDPRTTDTLRDFAQSLFAGHVERAVDSFSTFLVPSGRTDLAAARRDLASVLRNYVESTRVVPDGFASEELFEIEVFGLVRRHAMSLSPDAALYLKAVLTAEATVKELDPEFDLAAHENRFFHRLLRLEAVEAIRPANLERLFLDARHRMTKLLDALDRLSTPPPALAELATGVRRSVQILGAVSIAGTLAVAALVWTMGKGALLGSPRRLVALAAALLTLFLLLLAIRHARRLPGGSKRKPE